MKRIELIAELEERRVKLAKKLADLKLEERISASKSNRRKDNRRKILIGAMILSRVRNGQLPEAEVRAWLTAFLQKPEEQDLFPPDQAL